MTNGLSEFINILLVLVAIFFGTCIYFAADKFLGNTTLESKTRLVPEIRLHTDGKTVDTIFIYKLKK